MSESDPTQRLQSNDEEVEFDELEDSGYVNGPLYDKVYETAEKFAGTYVGQYATGKVDRILKLIEDTAKWSLPAINNNQNKNDSNIKLERPLPWIPFIMLILILRIVRIALSTAGLMIGNAPLLPRDVVYFIQTRRRKLRAIRIAGMRQIQKKERAKRHSPQGGLISRLTSIMLMAICRPRLSSDSLNILVSQNSFEGAGNSSVNKTQQNDGSLEQQCFENESISDHELTLAQILDKYGGSSNEDDDSDFIPPSGALNDRDTSSKATSSSSSSSDEDGSNEEESLSVASEVIQPMSNNKPESNVDMTNGNNSIEIQDQSMEIRENGEPFNKIFRKPKIMPKPIKSEPLPMPIQEIKLEPAESYEDQNTNSPNFGNSEELKTSNYDNLHQQQQSVVALENDCEELNKDIGENGKDKQNEKLNGDQNLPKSGSPNLCGAFGFYPTSILKNCEAVSLEKRGHTETIAANEDFIRAESTKESDSSATLRAPKNTNHTGKPIKNKFRGKRR